MIAYGTFEYIGPEVGLTKVIHAMDQMPGFSDLEIIEQKSLPANGSGPISSYKIRVLQYFDRDTDFVVLARLGCEPIQYYPTNGHR